MSRPPVVSVVVPCRNEAKYVGRMLDSILANEYPRERLEVLIVDGLSDDGTRAVISDYASRHPVIRVIDNPHRTTPYALNLGISRSRGTIIMRMDAHTYYPPNYIADLSATPSTASARMSHGKSTRCRSAASGEKCSSAWACSTKNWCATKTMSSTSGC